MKLKLNQSCQCGIEPLISTMSSTSGESEKELAIETADVQVIAFCVLVASVFIGYCYHTYNRFSKIE